MKRREMIKRSTFAVCGVVAGQRFSWAGSKESASLLLEAAQFQNHGGWGLDSQYMDLMGSGFLIAHGIGKPVEDAVAKVEFPETGTYRLWVRTRDWVAPWKKADTPETKRARGTPGIFEVKVDGKSVGTFGNEGEEWHWQDGGTIDVTAAQTAIALRDLTGFAGRCAGIFLTKDATLVPPDGGKALAAFRRKWHGYPEKPEEAGRFELVVVGGGVAGMCAAVVASRQGVKVALIQDRPMVGGNNSSEVRMHLSGTARSNYSETLGDGTMPGEKLPLEVTVLKPGEARRAADTATKYQFNVLPQELKAMQCVVFPRGNSKVEAEAFSFNIDAPAEVHIAVHDRGGFVPPEGWRKTVLKTKWSDRLTDTVYVKRFAAGTVELPGHSGKSGNSYGLPHAAFVPAGIAVSK